MLPKTCEYALRAAVWLGQEPMRKYSADRLAEVTRVPRRYLHTVLQSLVRAGIADSQPGPHGGYSLARSAAEVTILDVINAVSPLERIRSCPLGLESHTSLCPLHLELDNAYAMIEQAFARVTLSEVIQRSGRVRPLCETSGAAGILVNLKETP